MAALYEINHDCFLPFDRFPRIAPIMNLSLQAGNDRHLIADILQYELKEGLEHAESICPADQCVGHHS